MASAVGGGAFRDRGRAESFGAIAAQYDRARPQYPAALFDELATLPRPAAEPRRGVDTLDVGCGTGKASVLLAERGLQVLGVEVDPGMATIARGHGIEVEVSSFEDWDDRGRRFDLITSAQAWHWVDPEAGARKAAHVLRPDGAVALFWNVHAISPELRERFEAVYERHAPDLAGRMTGLGLRRGSNQAAVAEPGLVAAGLTNIAHRRYDWRQAYTRDGWLDLLATFSDHQLLAEPARSDLLVALGDAVDDLGGSLDVEYSTLLLLARR